MDDRDPIAELVEAEERLAGERPRRPLWPTPDRLALLEQLRELHHYIDQELNDKEADRQYALEQVEHRLAVILRSNRIDPDATGEQP